MLSRLEISPAKKFIGLCRTMSFCNNHTYALWRDFMPKRKEINSIIGLELYSVEQYSPQFFDNFNENALYQKWAAVEVTDLNNVPDGMAALESPEGLYAVFLHKGPAANGPETYRYIFTEWLPASGYLLDNRPHFAVMGEKYKPESADSEEEIWIPVKKSE